MIEMMFKILVGRKSLHDLDSFGEDLLFDQLFCVFSLAFLLP